MSDFIQEVDEEYRRDRIMALLSRYQVLIALIVVGIIAGAGGYRYYLDRKATYAEKVNDRYMAAADLARAGKIEEADAAYASLAKDAPAGYAMLARLRGAETKAAKDPEGAARDLDALAGDESLPASLRDTARLRSALIRIDTLDPQAFETRYGRFAAPGFGYAASMRELLALAAMKRGAFDSATKMLDAIVIDPNAPAALRGRAEALRLIASGGVAQESKTAAPPASVTVLKAAETPAPAAAPAANPTPSAPAAGTAH